MKTTGVAQDGDNLKGVLLMMLAMVVVPGMDGIAKFLSAEFEVTQIVWARYVSMTLVLLPFAVKRHGGAAFTPPRPLIQLLRGLLLLGSTFFFFSAIAAMPITDALAMIFIYPLVVTLLSSLLLGEVVRLRRWSAVAVGFLGVLIVLRPGLTAFDSAALYALAAGVSHGSYIVITRHLSGSASPLQTLFFTGIVGSLVMTLAVPEVWKLPQGFDWAWMLALGLLAAVGHSLIIRACDFAPASLLAPLGYIEIVSATIIGYFVFGDFPDLWTWGGMAVIVASGCYISWRETRRDRAAKRAARLRPEPTP